MPTFGYTGIGSSVTTLSADYQRGGLFTIPEGGWVTKISARLDGNGGGTGTQKIRAAIYNNGNTYPTSLKGVSAEVTISAGQAASWVEFVFSPVVYLPPGNYWLHLHSGANNNVGRYYRNTTGGTLVSGISDIYSDGTRTSIPSGATISAHQMSIYATYTPAWSPINTPPTETTLDVIRIFRGMGPTYVDLTSGTAQGYNRLTFTKVLNQPGSLEMELVATTPKQLNSWIDENSLLEFWLAGVRQGCYIVDEFTPSWGACTATVKALGALAWAQRALYDSGGSEVPPIDAALLEEFVRQGVNGAIGMDIWQWDASKVNIGSTTLGTKASGSNCLDWLAGIAPLLGTNGARFWIDNAWKFNAALLKDPLTGQPDRVYSMNTSCFEFTTTYSARDIYNRVMIICPNAPSPGFVVCEHAASQALYGIRTHEAVQYDAAKTLAAATAYGNRLLAEWAMPQLSMTLTVPHDWTTEPGMLAQVVGLDDGRTYRGIIQQISWTLGEPTDEVIVAYKPPTIASVIGR